ncbi:hypothetical protein EJ08DRAFT_653562 [Tothia fuscella]|uniref:Tachykinin family protein n=1 Tax=Tothia fuscella TaxID=1048955 RepID=A0A9P4NH45_9PEZI|nr:hypothetical protein EJ08DRAFT_653562 [Tothia fuscella]
MEVRASPASSREAPFKPFEFITFSKPNESKEDARRRIRRAAAAGPRRRTKKEKLMQNEVVLDIAAPSPRDVPIGQSKQLHIIASAQSTEFKSSPSSILSASRIDPFFSYPIDMSPRDLELYNHLFDGTCNKFRTMRDIGFFTRIRESTGFLQVISSSSWSLAHLKNTGDKSEYLHYNDRAMKQLQRRIRDPAHSLGIDVVLGIMTFVCFANLSQNKATLRIHLAGLQDIVERRGGLLTLDPDPTIKMMLFLTAVNSAHMDDIVPIFPLPAGITSQYNKIPQFPIRNLDPPDSGSSLDDDPVIQRTIADMAEINSQIRLGLHFRNLWADPNFANYHLLPLLHGLLSQPRPITLDLSGTSLRLECFRLAAILYVTSIRERFGFDDGSENLYVLKIKAFLGGDLPNWHGENVYLMWILLNAAVSSQTLSTVCQNWFLSRLYQVASLEGITSVKELRSAMIGFCWSEKALGDRWVLLTEENFTKHVG